MSATMAARAHPRSPRGPLTSSHAVAPKPIAAGTTGCAEPAAVGVDLGSGYVRIWASGRPMIDVPATNPATGTGLISRGRIVDPQGLAFLLRQLLARYTYPLPTGSLLVACRPVLNTAEPEQLTRDILDDVFAPSRVLFIDAVRAAAIGAGARSGPLLVADAGAELTELAVVADGRVVAARRRDRGAKDEAPGRRDGLVRALADLRRDLYDDPAADGYLAEAERRPLLLAGGAAVRSRLAADLAGHLNMAVRAAAAPRLAAARGAGLAALSALRRSATAPSSAGCHHSTTPTASRPPSDRPR